MPSRCLNDNELGDYLAGELPAETQSSWERHLRECQRCRLALEDGRSEDDALLAELRDAMAATEPGMCEDGSSADSLPLDDLNEVVGVDGYRLLELVHRGGQGVVYKARQLATRRTVALKLLKDGAYHTARQRLRFEREIDLVASLRHPHIVTLYDSGVAGERPYFAMEFIEGQPIDAAMGNSRGDGRAWSVPEVLELFGKVCDGAAYAHRRGVIHRDLKPANILVDEEGRPHLLDFGLAKLDATSSSERQRLETASGEFLGTLAYASPEQLAGTPQAVDTRTDVYSLGVILFQALTGEFPYDVGGSITQTIDNIRHAVPSRPSTFRSELDDEVETIVMTALAKEPERRYQSADLLGKDLKHYLAGDPIDAKRDSTWYVLRKSLARYRAAVAATVVVAGVILAALAVSLTFWHRAASDRDAAVAAKGEAERAEASESLQRSAAESSRLQAEYDAYLARMSAAYAALQSNDVSSVVLNMNRAPVGLRHWEWQHLGFRVDESLAVVRGHQSYVEQVRFRPRGSEFASISWDQTLRIWDTESRETLSLHTFDTHGWCLEYAPDGSLLVVGTRDGSLHIFDAGSRSLEFELEYAGRLEAIAFAPDNRHLAASYSLAGPDPLKSRHRLVIWDLDDRSIRHDFDHDRLMGDLEYDRENRWLLCSEIGAVRVLDAGSGAVLRERVFPGTLGSVAHVEGTELAVAAGPTIYLYDFEQDEIRHELHGHQSHVHALRYDGTSNVLWSASRDKTVRSWNVSTSSPIRILLGHTWTVTDVDLHPDGQRLISASWDYTVRIWDTTHATGTRVLTGHEMPILSLVFRRDGRELISASRDGSFRRWDVWRGRLLQVCQAHEEPIQSIAVSPDERLCATGSWDGTIRTWRIGEDEPLHTLQGHTSRVHGVVFLDNVRLVSGSTDNTLRVWNLEDQTCEHILHGHDDHIHCVAASPDGRWLASAGHQSVVLWDTETWELVRRLPRTIVQDDFSLEFSQDSRYLAAGTDIRMVGLWEIPGGELVRRMDGHTDELHSVSFYPDGSRLASASFDGAVKLWDPRTGQPVATLENRGSPPNVVRFGPEGHWLAVGRQDGSVVLYRGYPRVPTEEATTSESPTTQP